MSVIDQLELKDSNTTVDLGSKAQYVEVSRDNNGDIIEDVTAPGVTVDTTEGLSTTLIDIYDTLDEKEDVAVILTETLDAGDTTLTFSDVAITSNSRFDIYASIYGVSPRTMTVTTGQAVLTFKAQSSNMSVKLFVYE